VDSYLTSPIPPFHTVAGAAIGTFTAFQDILQNPAGTNIERPMLYGRQVRVGQKIELEAWGEFSTTATPTLQLGFWYGTAATVLLASAATTTGSGAAAWPWHLKAHLMVTSIVGTAGTAQVQGICDLGTSITAMSGTAMPITAAARVVSSLDFSVNKELGVGAAWGTSSASNTVKCSIFSALLVN
jgi:hypothetical protein